MTQSTLIGKWILTGQIVESVGPKHFLVRTLDDPGVSRIFSISDLSSNDYIFDSEVELHAWVAKATRPPDDKPRVVAIRKEPT
jgi:hypothetical protein